MTMRRHRTALLHISDLAHYFLHWCWMSGLLVNLLGLKWCTALATHIWHSGFSHRWSRVNDQTGISANPNKFDCCLSVVLPRCNIPRGLISACWSVPITCFPLLSRHFLCVMLCFLFLFSSPIQIKSLVLIPLYVFPLQTLPFFETCVLTFSWPERRLPPDQLDLCNRSTSEKQCWFRKYCLLLLQHERHELALPLCH